MTNNIWKVWLRPYRLVKAERVYVAQVAKESNTLRNEDIARLMKAEGFAMSEEILLAAFDCHDRMIRDLLRQGYCVQTRTCRFAPRVRGLWRGRTARFDPGIHKPTVDVVLTAELREAVKDIQVEVIRTEPLE